MCDRLNCKGNHVHHYHPVTHCIFDLDGTLLDSETIHETVIDEILKQYGHRYSIDLRKKVMGRKTEDGWKTIIDEFRLKVDLNDLIAEFDRQCHEPLANCPLLPGVERLLHHLHKYKIPLAIATSSTKDSFLHKTKPYKGLFSAFSHAVCGGNDPEVKESKPRPDIYLICAQRFSDNPCPSKCLVFEDSATGVIAARTAAMQCVAIPDKVIPKDTFHHATLILNSLEEFVPETFGLPPYKK